MVVSYRGDHRGHEGDEVPNDVTNGGDSSSSINGRSVAASKQEKMVKTANQKHALSERERRKRINSHYDTLRQLFPRLIKTDKASVLTETVRRIKELKNMVAAIGTPHDDRDRCPMRQLIFIPGEYDEVSISCSVNGDKTSVRAIICCDDRPDLNQRLAKAIRSAHGKAVMAEMATLGGRTKVDMLVEWPQCCDTGEDVRLLRRALEAVVEGRIIGPAEFMDHGFIEPDFIALGRRFANGLRHNVCDQTENGYAADGIISRSS